MPVILKQDNNKIEVILVSVMKSKFHPFYDFECLKDHNW